MGDRCSRRMAAASLGPCRSCPAALILVGAADPVAGVGRHVRVGLIIGGLARAHRARHGADLPSEPVVNFAQADLGTLPATLALLVMEAWGFPYLVAPAARLPPAASCSAAVVELLFIRRFFKAPRLILTVATIGISQLLAVRVAAVPAGVGPDPGRSARSSRRSPPRSQIGSVVFDANDILGADRRARRDRAASRLFLRATDTGIAIRAAAEACDRAGMLGVPVKRLQTAGVGDRRPCCRSSRCSSRPASPASPAGCAVHARRPAAGAGRAGDRAHVEPGRDRDHGASRSACSTRAIRANSRRRQPRRPAILGRDHPGGAAAAAAGRDPPRTTRTRRRGRRPTEVRPIARRRWPASASCACPVRARLRPGRARSSSLPHVVGTDTALKAGAVLIFAIDRHLDGGAVGLGRAGVARSDDVRRRRARAVATGAPSTVASTRSSRCCAGRRGRRGGRRRRRACRRCASAASTSRSPRSPSRWPRRSCAVQQRRSVDWIPDRDASSGPDLLGRISLDSATRVYYLALVVLRAHDRRPCVGIRRSRTGRVLDRVARQRGGAARRSASSVVRGEAHRVRDVGVHRRRRRRHVRASTRRRSEPTPTAPSESITVFVGAVIGGLGTITGAVLGAVYLRGAQWLLPRGLAVPGQRRSACCWC